MLLGASRCCERWNTHIIDWSLIALLLIGCIGSSRCGGNWERESEYSVSLNSYLCYSFYTYINSQSFSSILCIKGNLRRRWRFSGAIIARCSRCSLFWSYAPRRKVLSKWYTNGAAKAKFKLPYRYTRETTEHRRWWLWRKHLFILSKRYFRWLWLV